MHKRPRPSGALPESYASSYTQEPVSPTVAMSPGLDSTAGPSERGNRRCRFCSFVTQYPSALSRHERIHTGEKPFKCRFCPFRSAQRCHAMRHELQHLRGPNGKRPSSSAANRTTPTHADTTTTFPLATGSDVQHNTEAPHLAMKRMEETTTGTTALNSFVTSHILFPEHSPHPPPDFALYGDGLEARPGTLSELPPLSQMHREIGNLGLFQHQFGSGGPALPSTMPCVTSVSPRPHLPPHHPTVAPFPVVSPLVFSPIPQGGGGNNWFGPVPTPVDTFVLTRPSRDPPTSPAALQVRNHFPTPTPLPYHAIQTASQGQARQEYVNVPMAHSVPEGSPHHLPPFSPLPLPDGLRHNAVPIAVITNLATVNPVRPQVMPGPRLTSPKVDSVPQLPPTTVTATPVVKRELSLESVSVPVVTSTDPSVQPPPIPIQNWCGERHTVMFL